MPARDTARPKVSRAAAQVGKALVPAQPDAGYDRARDLPKLLPMWPHELETPTAGDHARLLARMRAALRRERQRGLAGHWAYDLARHAALLRAYRAEAAACLRRRR
jgi:hypothetical protein